MGKILIALLALAPTIASANYAECLLRELPGSPGDMAARVIVAHCVKQYPGGFESVPQGSGRGLLNNRLLGHSDGTSCAAAYARETPSNLAMGAINMACKRLFDPALRANYFNQFDASPVSPSPAPGTVSQPTPVNTPTSSSQAWIPAPAEPAPAEACVIRPVMSDAEIAACRNTR